MKTFLALFVMTITLASALVGCSDTGDRDAIYQAATELAGSRRQATATITFAEMPSDAEHWSSGDTTGWRSDSVRVTRFGDTATVFVRATVTSPDTTLATHVLVKLRRNADGEWIGRSGEFDGDVSIIANDAAIGR